MMAFSADIHFPSYYRIVPGNVRDVTAFKQSVIESGITNMTVIADKGFGSKDNFSMLEEHDLKYIVPLRRNNSMINREKLKTGDKSDFDGYFLYKERVILAAIANCANNVVQKFRVLRRRTQAGLREKQVKDDNENTRNLCRQDLCDLQ